MAERARDAVTFSELAVLDPGCGDLGGRNCLLRPDRAQFARFWRGLRSELVALGGAFP